MTTPALRVDDRPLRPVEVMAEPFMRRIIEFRSWMGYPGPLFDADPPPAPRPATAVPAAQRIGEVVRLLEMPGCPQPRTAFEAYCLAFQLIVTVDNRCFGRFHPTSAAPQRLGTPSPSGMFELAGSRRVCLPGRDMTLILGSQGNMELWLRTADAVRLFPRSPGRAAFPALQPDPRGSFQHMQRHVHEASAAAPLRRGASKRERMERFLAALVQSPPAGDPLEAMAGVNLLLESMERAHFGAEPAPGHDERLYSIFPFTVFASPAFPGAALFLSTGHLIAYYPDGRIEIHERDRARDVRADNRLVSITPRRCVAAVAGRNSRLRPARPSFETVHPWRTNSA